LCRNDFLLILEPLMLTECSAELLEFAAVERHVVVAGFDGGAITSDAGALLLGATDRAIGWSIAWRIVSSIVVPPIL
jgi:hypothetical protein